MRIFLDECTRCRYSCPWPNDDLDGISDGWMHSVHPPIADYSSFARYRAPEMSFAENERVVISSSHRLRSKKSRI